MLVSFYRLFSIGQWSGSLGPSFRLRFFFLFLLGSILLRYLSRSLCSCLLSLEHSILNSSQLPSSLSIPFRMSLSKPSSVITYSILSLMAFFNLLSKLFLALANFTHFRIKCIMSSEPFLHSLHSELTWYWLNWVVLARSM